MQSGRLRKDFEQLMVDIQSKQQKEFQEIKNILNAVIPTEKGEEDQENIETRVKRLEAVIERLEKYLSDLPTEKSVKEGPEQDTTCLRNSCNQIRTSFGDLLENLKTTCENWGKFAGISLKPENTTWKENDRPVSVRQGKDGIADRSQKDTEQTTAKPRKCEGATRKFVNEGRFKLNEIVQVASH